MIKLYFKQAFHLLGENKLLSSISIIGTALAIAMIMVIVITLRATIAPFAPETHRDRMLIFRFAGLQNKSNVNWQSNGPIGYNTAKACFKAMTIPEVVSITNIWQETMLAAKPAGEMESCSVLQTDDAFWKIFEFEFLSGKPYDNADFDAGAAKAVVSEDMARRLFGTSEVVGKTFLLNHSAYIVCGVVRPVSKLAKYAYAQVWIPLSSTSAFTATWGDDNIMGMTAVYILAKSKDDFPAIRQEADRLRAIFMAGHPNFDLLYRGQPDTYFVAAQRYSANNPPAVKEAVRQYILTLLVLLIVPAVNLSGLTLSRMRKRISEIGVRKAFGAPQTGAYDAGTIRKYALFPVRRNSRTGIKLCRRFPFGRNAFLRRLCIQWGGRFADHVCRLTVRSYRIPAGISGLLLTQFIKCRHSGMESNSHQYCGCHQRKIILQLI